MIYCLLLLSIYIWPFGQLLSFTLPTVPFTIYFLDLVVAILFVTLVISPKRKQYFASSYTKSYLIFLFIVAISLLVNKAFSFYALRLVFYPALFLSAKEFGLKRLKIPIITSVSIFVVLGLVQYLFIPDMRFLKNLGFDDHYFRLIGTFFDPNFSGAVLSFLALYLIGNKKYLFSLLFVGLLALTFSRASYLCFAAGLLYLLIANKQLKLIIILFILGILVYLIPKPFGEGVNLLRTFSIYSRLESWHTGLQLFSQRPLLGWGYNVLNTSIDNSFIVLLATTGVFGFASFLLFLKKIISKLGSPSAIAVFLALILHSQLNNSFFYIWIFAYFLLFLGLNTQDQGA